MPIEIVMPKLGLTMASGTIARWIKQPGEAVREGEPLVEVSTDKINYEVESPASGTVVSAMGNDGDEFACGDVIGLIALAGEQDTPVAAGPRPSSSGTPDGAERPPFIPDMPTAKNVVEAPLVSSAADTGPDIATTHANGVRVVASPAARRLARERGISLTGVRGTGPRGRITLTDVHTLQPAPTDARRPVAEAAPDVAPAPRPAAEKGAVPPRLPAARRAIFRKMTEVGTLPLAQVETIVRVDAVKALIERRRDFRWTAFAVYAVARLLRNHDTLRTDATTGAPFDNIDIGVAADTPQGLIVPVVRNAANISLAEIEREITRLAALARDGSITMTDIGGACFSISNVGPQGIDRVAPLPDTPQTAILGIGAATERPAIIEGTLTASLMMTCVLTFDHRFIDGAPAARFLSALSQAYSDPTLLL